MRSFSALVLMTAILATPIAALADWHDRDIHHFHEYDYDHWRGGSWVHGFHDGRDGWWWTVDGAWYYYPAPIYPYPDPYTPPAVVVETAPPAPAGAPAPYVYYCANPAGYYPYVPQCAGPWERVASSVTPTPPPPQVVVPAESEHDADLHRVNTYSEELGKINPQDPDARTKLKVLNKHVEAFRQSLYKRHYNTLDIMRDADDLKHRIAVAREALPKVVVVPAPSSVPSGTIIEMPPR